MKEVDKQVKTLQSTVGGMEEAGKRTGEELEAVKQFVVETKTTCSSIVEALDLKVTQAEQLSVASANSVRRFEEHCSKPVKLCDLTARELQSIETRLKSDLSQSIDQLNTLVQQTASDQRTLSTTVSELFDQINRGKQRFWSPIQAFREKREQSLTELKLRMRGESEDVRSVTSLRDPAMIVTVAPRAGSAATVHNPPRSVSPTMKAVGNPHRKDPNSSLKRGKPHKKGRTKAGKRP